MNKCTILYGMSGTLKESTIMSYIYSESFKIYSDTKPFFELDENYFNWSSRVNDCHLAIHRLLTLRLPGFLPFDKDIVIERGVTDNLFCVPNRKISGLESYDDMKINELVKLEENFINRNGNTKINKILLIMKDSDFIASKVIDQRHRKAIYPDLSTYLSKQDEYVEFTKKWNIIDEEVVIDDARYYIENVLKQKFNG